MFEIFHIVYVNEIRELQCKVISDQFFTQSYLMALEHNENSCLDHIYGVFLFFLSFFGSLHDKFPSTFMVGHSAKHLLLGFIEESE